MNSETLSINVSNTGMPSPFSVIFFDMTQFTLAHNPMHIHDEAKLSHIPLHLQNMQNSQWTMIVFRKQGGRSLLIPVTSNMKFLTLERK
jgi:hypothetical protein